MENFNVSTAVKIHCLVSGLLAACDQPTLAAALSGAIASKPRGIGLVYLSPINNVTDFGDRKNIITTLLFWVYFG